jgi:hypothetical protein
MDQNDVLRLLKQFPHCDQSVLHAPKSCTYCDQHEDWQALRLAWGVNFTGETDPEKMPCPSSLRRSARMVHAWPGNRPTNVEVPLGPRTAFEHILEDSSDDEPENS